MKKFMFMAIAAVAMVACGGNQAANENECTNETCEETCEATLDIEAFEAALACDNAETIAAALTTAQEEVAKLVSLEKSAEAFSLADAVLVSIAKNAENLEAQSVDFAPVAEALEAVKAASENAVAAEVVEAAEAAAE